MNNNEIAPAFNPVAILSKTSNPEITAEYRNGIKLRLRYVAKAKFLEISQSCMELQYDEQAKERVNKINAEKFANKYLAYCVLGWEGVTLESLSSLCPFDIDGVTEEQLKQDIPFTVAALRTITEQCYGLDTFINESVTNMQVFRPRLTAQVKN